VLPDVKTDMAITKEESFGPGGLALPLQKQGSALGGSPFEAPPGGRVEGAFSTEAAEQESSRKSGSFVDPKIAFFASHNRCFGRPRADRRSDDEGACVWDVSWAFGDSALAGSGPANAAT
jgi:hypothetical protein